MRLVGRPLADDMQPHVVTNSEGFGYIPNGKAGTGLRDCRKLVLEGETYQPAAKFPFTKRLGVTLAMPGLLPEHVVGWEPVADRASAPPESYQRAVLAMLDRLEQSADRRAKAPTMRYTLTDPGDLYKAPHEVTTAA